MGTVLVTGKVRWVQRDGVRKKTNLKDWYVVVDTGHDANRKRRRHWSRKFETKAAAMRHRNEIARDVGASTWQEPSNERLDSFVAKTWLPAAKPSLRQSTWASYERYLRVHVLPEIGGTQLRDVTPQQLNLLYAKLLASGRRGPRPGGPLSPRTVRYVHTILHRVFRDAERWGLVPRNPARFALPGRANASGRREQTTWTEEDVRAFLTASRAHRGRGHAVGDRMYGAWVLLITTGLRRGELLGLRRSDIDFDRKLFSVRQTAILEYHEGRRTVVFGEPKTNSGRRVVALDRGTLAELREHRIQLVEERLAAGEKWEDHDLVMPGRLGKPFDPEYFSREFRSRLKRYGLKDIRLHDLRHTHATLALEAGVHPKVVSERLGHSGVAITLDLYSHVSIHMQAEAAELVAGPLLRVAGEGSA